MKGGLMSFKKFFPIGSSASLAFAVFFASCSENNSSGPAEFASPTPFELDSVSSSELPESSAELLQSSSSEETSSANSSSANLSYANISYANLSSVSLSSAQSSSATPSSSATSSSSVPTATNNSSSSSAGSSKASIPVPYGCVVSKEEEPLYENYEDPECVIKQLTQFVVDSLVKQGIDPTQAFNTAKLKLYSVFSIDTLLQTTSLHSASIGTALSLLVPVDDATFKTRTEFIEAFSKGETFDYEYRCRAYENFSTANLIKFNERTSPWYQVTNSYTYQDAMLILRNLWRYCGQLPVCNSQNANLYKTYTCQSSTLACQDKGKDFICTTTWTTSYWTAPTATQTETHDKECVENNTRFPSDSFPKQFYVCYEGNWHFSKESQLGKLPQEYFFNDNIKYGTMEDPRDGKKYRTVVYENQVWMAENINYYDENDSLLKNHSQCSKKIGCDYGRFYDVDAAAKACPNGWHLPKKEDIAKWIEMPYSESSEYMPKLFARFTGTRMASDEFGLSILSINNIDPYGWDENGATSGFFWLDSRNFIRITDVEAYIIPQVDPRENGQLLPVRCIKN